MIDLPSFDEIIENLRRSILHLIDINTGVEQQRMSGDPLFAHERQLIIGATRQGRCGSKSRPAPSGVEAKVGQ